MYVLSLLFNANYWKFESTNKYSGIHFKTSSVEKNRKLKKKFEIEISYSRKNI